MAKAAAKAKAEAAHAEAQSKQNGGNGNISTLEASGSDSTTKRKTSINYYGNTGVTYSFSRISEGVFIFDDQDLFDGESPSENIRNDKHASDYQGGLKFGNIDNSVGSTNGETVRPSNLVKANANGNIVGGGLTITIENTSEMFFSVFEAKIEVLPYS